MCSSFESEQPSLPPSYTPSLTTATHFTTTVFNTSTVIVQQYSALHTLWSCAVELASALTAAIILADAPVTPPSPKWPNNVEWDVNTCCRHGPKILPHTILLSNIYTYTGSKVSNAQTTRFFLSDTKSSPPMNLHIYSLISVQSYRSTRSLDVVTFSSPPFSFSLKVNNRSFRHASPCLWNHLPKEIRQPADHEDLSLSSDFTHSLHVSIHHFLHHHCYHPWLLLQAQNSSFPQIFSSIVLPPSTNRIDCTDFSWFLFSRACLNRGQISHFLTHLL